jgi:hypothetical protein
VSEKKRDYLPLTVLMYGAFAVAAASLAWGALVYSEIAKMSGESAGAYMHCVVLLSGSCNFYRGMGWMQGLNPYEPLVFWWAVSLAGVAVLFRWRERRAVA